MSAENPGSFREPTRHSFKEIEADVTVVNPGDTITGFETLVELDRCAAALARVAFGEHRFMQDGRAVFGSVYNFLVSAADTDEMRRMNGTGRIAYRPWSVSSRMPSSVMAPGSGGGFITDIQATLLGEVKVDDEATTCPFNLAISADLKTTGWGKIGHASKIMSGVEKLIPNLHRYSRRPIYQDLGDDNVKRAAKRLRAVSSRNARRIESENLRHSILSDIPTLGDFKG